MHLNPRPSPSASRRNAALVIGLLLLAAPSFGCSSESASDPLSPGSGTGGSQGGPGGNTGGSQGGPSGSGGGIQVPVGGAAGMSGNGTSGADCHPQPVGLLRDFKIEHPDFEYTLGDDRGIVATDLGSDKKPVFAGGTHKTVTTAENFDQWYRDVPDVNKTVEFQLPFTTAASGNLVYDNTSFFPLDGQGWGNEGNRHNFHFTYELHMEFKYSGGEVFNFRGDDDVFVFVNNKLAIDLGGVHSAQAGQLNLDQSAAMLGISPGNTYPIDFFQAERHTSESNFRIETSLAFSNCTPIIVR
ncbi:MAG TPA: fibro-slime domain-containing protein [Polyangiaceae bacterium]|nr:fibro-slime domain-containing protein [Polyangiaceae bacterium]